MLDIVDRSFVETTFSTLLFATYSIFYQRCRRQLLSWRWKQRDLSSTPLSVVGYYSIYQRIRYAFNDNAY
jgi:hypothetical protein